MLQCSWLKMCLFQVYGKVIQVFMYLFILKFFSYLGYYRTLSRAPWAMGFPGGSDGKESGCNVGDQGSIPGLGRSPRGGHGNPLQYSCLENPHGQRSLVGYSSWGHKESDMTERLSTVYIYYTNGIIILYIFILWLFLQSVLHSWVQFRAMR